MDDLRFEWLRRRVDDALDIKDPQVFEELLSRDDGEGEMVISRYLNQKLDESTQRTLLFYKTVSEVEEEIEVECEAEPMLDISGVSEAAEIVAASGDELPPAVADIRADVLPAGDTSTASSAAPAAAFMVMAPPEDGAPMEATKPRSTSRRRRNRADVGSTTPCLEPQVAVDDGSMAGTDYDQEPDSRQPKTRLIVQMVKRTHLHTFLGEFPPENSSLPPDKFVHFVRVHDDMVPLPTSIADADEMLASHFEMGVVNGHSLDMLEQLLNLVYIPLLSFNQQRDNMTPGGGATRHTKAPTSGHLTMRFCVSDDVPEDGSVASGSDSATAERSHHQRRPSSSMSDADGGDQLRSLLRDEFVIGTQKFAAGIRRTMQHIEGEVRLDVPDLVWPSDDPDTNAANEELRRSVEVTCRNWHRQIDAALDVLQKKTPQGKGPLAEIDYWRERNAALSALFEQLRAERVQRFLDVYSHIDTSFEYLRQDLCKFYTEAKDNVRFLSTLERHFKNVTHGTTFQAVIDTLPSMMNALRMVWIISRHYNRDERMVPLMEMIAWELAERVSRVITPRTLFK